MTCLIILRSGFSVVTLQSLASELFGVFDDRDYIFVRSVSDTCTAVLAVPSLVVEACINLSRHKH